MKAKYFDLENKRVFITGGGSGMGASIVEHFCEQNSEVYFIDINEEASNKLVELIQITPALILGAISKAKFIFSVHILEAKPYGVLLASETASFGVRKDNVVNTGPKISTWAIKDAGVTLVNNVGG